MGTGAFTAAELDGRTAEIGVVNDSNGLIGLSPGSTDYVYYENGELTIDFTATGDGGGSGVNPNSTYQVGGLGGFDSNNIDMVPGDPTTDPSVGGIAIDTETPINGEDGECAFMVMNQTKNSKDIELTYEANGSFPDNTRLFLVAYYPGGSNNSQQEEGLAVGDVANSENGKSASIIFDDDQQYSASIGSGEKFYVTILVDVGDVDPESDNTDLGGELVVRAGSHDDFTNADAQT